MQSLTKLRALLAGATALPCSMTAMKDYTGESESLLEPFGWFIGDTDQDEANARLVMLLWNIRDEIEDLTSMASRAWESWEQLDRTDASAMRTFAVLMGHQGDALSALEKKLEACDG